MNPQINIYQTFGQIGLRYQNMQWNIRTKSADLQIQSEPAQLSIENRPGNLQIDQSEAFAQEGLMSPLDLSKNQAQQAESVAIQGISDTVEWGNTIARTRSKDHALGDWALRYANSVRDVEVGLTPGPFSVHVKYELGKLTIHAQQGALTVNINPNRPDVSFQAGNVHTDMERPASIRVVPPTLGQLIDMQA